MSKNEVLILDNLLSDVIKSRIKLGEYLSTKGYRVRYCCPNENNYPNVDNIQFSRSRINPLQIIKALFTLFKLEKKYGVATVMSFRLLPNLLNVFSAFLNPKVHRVLVITGLGIAFMDKNRNGLARHFISKFYKLSSKRFEIIVQNREDAKDLKLQSFKVINGSGVTGGVVSKNFEDGKIRLLYAGRLLKSKGVMEGLEIYRLLKERNINVSFTVAGEFDKQNPDSIAREDYLKLRSTKGVELLGYVKNMDDIYSRADVLLFLSTYREGVPRVIIESLRYGLTICTLNMPGCKEGVNENGILLKSIQDIKSVVEYIQMLNENKLNENMITSHMLFNSKFSSKIVFREYLNALR